MYYANQTDKITGGQILLGMWNCLVVAIAAVFLLCSPLIYGGAICGAGYAVIHQKEIDAFMRQKYATAPAAQVLVEKVEPQRTSYPRGYRSGNKTS